MNVASMPVRGGMFSIELAQDGTGFPTVYLHDELVPPAVQPWMDQLATTRRLIAPQHPGFGRSTGVEHLDDVVDLTIFYLDFLDALGLGSLDLIGSSFGGMIAAEIASLAPERVRRLALISPIGLWLNHLPVADVFGLSTDELFRATWADPEGAAAREHAPNVGNEYEQRRAAIERTRSLAAAGRFVWPIPDKGLRKRIHRIKAPTLLIWGSDDRIAPPAYGRLFQQKIRGADLVTISGAGHLPLLERPTDTLAALRSFLGN